MADHPNAALLRKGYDAFAKGDTATLTDLFSEDVVWHLPGRNLISGEHKGRDAVFAVFAKTMELTGGTFKIDLHDIVANDEHTVSLSRASASRQGKQLDLRGVDIYHIRNGKVTEWWSFNEDQRQDDEFWS
ncbi:MAG: nuclear transport factor 2 family protein [Dehalococcoidia bacterium]|jgi:ketosteroid isomerase-like protein|nr:nuclear transport factor 2 family protein [Dehalococcoidia bacterium]